MLPSDVLPLLSCLVLVNFLWVGEAGFDSLATFGELGLPHPAVLVTWIAPPSLWLASSKGGGHCTTQPIIPPKKKIRARSYAIA